MYRMSGFLLSAFLISSQSALASAVNQPLDGENLIALYTGQSALTAADEETGKALAQLYANGYLNGVVDAGQGVHWCLPQNLLRGEVLSELVHQVAALPKLKRQQNGATLIADLLANTYPCK